MNNRVLFFTFVFFIFVVLCSAQQDTIYETYEYVLQWGRQGSGNGEFTSVRGLCVDKYNRIYVCDQSNGRVQVFDENGNFIRKFGSRGYGNGQFMDVLYITLDSSEYIYTADGDAMINDSIRIQKFDSLGNFVLKWGGKGPPPGKFSSIPSIAYFNGCVYTLDYSNNLVQKFDTLGNFVSMFSTRVDSETIVSESISIDDSSNIFIHKAGTPDSSVNFVKLDTTGSLLKKWGKRGSGQGEAVAVYSMANDYETNLYAADAWFAPNCRAQKFSSQGQFLAQIGRCGSGNGEFNRTWGIAVDSKGYVYVGDPALNRIQKFRKVVVGVSKEDLRLEDWRTELKEIYPNPFTHTASIHYNLEKDSKVSLKVYDISGRLVKTIVNDEAQIARGHVEYWDGRDFNGKEVSAGVYFIKLRVQGFEQMKKVVLVK